MTRSIDEPIRDWSYAEMWESGLAGKLIGQWDNGRRARARGLPAESQWKRDTLLHAAWMQGFNGESLDVGSPVAPRQESRGDIAADASVAPEADSMDDRQSVSRSDAATSGTLVAIDYLNLLVRCFHAGAPSDVHAVRGFLITVANVIKTLKPARLVIATDAGYEHRLELYPAYKQNRPPKPPGLQEQIDLGLEVVQSLGWPVARVLGYEADDVLASIVRTARDVVIVSCDKDLQQLYPTARIWRPFAGGGWVTSETIRETWGIESSQLGDLLALAGDSSDGVPGVEGIGPKTAAELLVQYGDLAKVIEAGSLCQLTGRAKCLAQAERRAEALLSRRLVELVDTLELGKIWEASNFFPTPRAGWQQRLQELRLFGAIKPLAEAVESLSAGGESQTSPVGAPTAARSSRPVARSLF